MYSALFCSPISGFNHLSVLVDLVVFLYDDLIMLHFTDDTTFYLKP